MHRSGFLPLSVLSAAAFFTSVATAKDSSTMKDLKALAKHESWEELYARALDVPPAARDDEWDDLVGKAATARLNEMKDADLGSFSYAKSLLDADRKAFPTLKKNKAYRHAGNEMVIKALKSCYQNRGDCRSGSDIDWLITVRKYVEENKDDAVAACSAGKMVQAIMVAYTALPMYAVAVAADKTCCKEPQMKEALKSGKNNPEYVEDAKKVSKACGF